MQGFLIRWFVTTVAVFVASYVVPGIDCPTFGSLITASLLLGFCNAVLKPILMFISLPLLILTFGLFTLVINSFLLLLVGYLVHGFHVAGWGSALFGSLIISVVSILLKPNRTFPTPPSGTSTKGNVQSNDRVIDV
jgi:putative membrane protein